MAKYLQGYDWVRRTIESRQDPFTLLGQLDALQGRGNLNEDSNIEDLKREALRQTALDWLDPTDPMYEYNRRQLERKE